MAQKAQYQSFQTNWNKTLNWANSQGIPRSAVYPVYQIDSKRLLTSGYQMSEAERTRAILAAANPNNVTPLPTDTQSPGSGIFGGIGHFFSNVEHDAANIFTGLQPTKLLPSIWDSVKNTVEHPDWLLNPEKNTIAQWVPGVAVLGEYMQGGWSAVMSHPLVGFLDVLPAADFGVGIVAKAGLGAALAERAGIPEALLGKSRLLGQDAQNGVGALSLARKLVGNTATKKQGIFKDAQGNTQFGPLTVHQRLKNYNNARMRGSDQAALAGAMQEITTAASHELASISKTWDESYAKLSPEEAKFAYDIWTVLDKVLGGQSRETLIADNRIPANIRDFLSETFKVVDHVQEKLQAAGDGGEVLMPDGTIEWRAASGLDSRVVMARDRAERSLEGLDKDLGEADRKADEIAKNDTIAGPAFDKLGDLKTQVHNAIKGTLGDPGTRATVADKLRPTLPGADRWDRLNINRASVGQLIGVDPAKVSLTQARLINEIYGPGGLIEKVQGAYTQKDFPTMVKMARDLKKRFNNQALNPTKELPYPLNTGLVKEVKAPASPVFEATKQLADNLYKYAVGRAKAEKDLSNALKKGNVVGKIKQYAKDQKAFETAQRDYPAATWQPLMVKLLYKHLAESEEGKVAVAKALEHYKSMATVERETIDAFRTDPTRLVEIIQTFTEASSTSVFAGLLSRETVERALSEAKDDVESLRARGFEPRWAPNVTSATRPMGDYEVKIPQLTYLKPDAAKSKLFDMNNTVYDLHAGGTKALYQEVQRDAAAKLIDEVLIPGWGHKQSDLVPIIEAMYPTLGGAGGLASDEAHLAQILSSEWGLTRFDPQARFGVRSTHIKGDDAIWVPKDILDGLEKSINVSQFDVSGAIAGATRVFRYSVLGYSPRFWAHIGLGGTFLLALRHPTVFRLVPDALRMMKDPDFRAKIHTTSTQVGYDKPESLGAKAFHSAAGKTLAYHWGQHLMEQLNLDPTKMSSWLKVIPQITFKVTNTMTDMQRSLAFLDGASKAKRRGEYVDPATGEKVTMTDERAQEEGMRAANRTMGHLAAMSPFERSTMTTIMPFYGWTKHILTYVVQYPVDHSYRAMFLANLANMNSDSVAKGYYTRIQNLLFLGAPAANGDVSAIDVRALNPLRDVANYATLGGFISALNPVISAPFAMVDPQIIFGSNTLYPTLTYSQLYGTKSGASAGTALTGIEAFVPEVTSIDAALGLSQQYRTLQKTNPNSFTKIIFSALNIPFAQVQHLNLKQIAAQQEIERYQTANAAAQAAYTSGDFSGLAGYPSVPDPQQALYNVTPSSLEALYNETLRTTALPPSVALPPLPAPAGL